MSKRNRVLVVGGGGFVGSHTAKALLAAGFDPVVYDNFSRGHRRLARFGEVIEGDIRDAAALDAALRHVRPVACLHFAAYAYVSESMSQPELYYQNNVCGSLTLFNALRRAGVDKIVFSSSCAVYGNAGDNLISESLPTKPISPYGRSKLMVEEILQDLSNAYGVRSVSLRYFNASGADPDGELGELHDPEPHLIPRALMAAAGRIEGLDINGADYPTVDGTAIRDYTHVSDLADAHVLALNYLLSGGATDVFNLGVEQGHSVRQVVESVERVTHRSVPVRMQPRRPGDPSRVIASALKAGAVLGFKPRHDELDRIIASAWHWFNGNGFYAR